MPIDNRVLTTATKVQIAALDLSLLREILWECLLPLELVEEAQFNREKADQSIQALIALKILVDKTEDFVQRCRQETRPNEPISEFEETNADLR